MKKKILCGLLAIIMCFALTGCGDNKPSENNSQNNNSNNNQNNNTNNPSGKEKGEDVIDFEFKEEDGKVIVKLTEDLVYVYYYEGDKVTDYEIYTGLSTHEDALSMLDITKQIQATETQEDIDWIDVKGRYLVYNYNEKGFNVTTYEELRDFAKAYNILLDANTKKNEKDQTEWPSIEYPRPENCVLLSLESEPMGLKLILKWDSKDAAKAYKDVIKKAGDFGTVEDTDNYFAFQGTKVRISYDANDEKNNYILFIENI